MPQLKWAISIVIADGYFNAPLGFACMYGPISSLYHPQGFL